MITVSIQLEDEEKRELDEILDSMGMTISTFYAVYTKTVLRERRIPFTIEAPVSGSRCDGSIERINRAKSQIANGEVIVKTLDELEDLAD